MLRRNSSSASPVRIASSVHGAIVTPKSQQPRQPLLNWQAIIDPINAVVLGSHYSVYVPYTNYETDPPSNAWANCGVRTDLATYDAASRKTGSTYSISGGSGDPNCADMSNTSSSDDLPTSSFAYDAENHHIGARGAQWTPGAQAYFFGSSNAYVHYDGNVPLFFTDTSGALTQIKLESVADINGGGLVSVWDRDMSGLLKAGHNNGYYGTIDLGETMYRGASLLQPLQVAFLGSANSTNLPWLFLYKHLDGFDYSGLTFQGSRAQENFTWQWTTPDAYAGDVHDPVSQKAFMWNRNNPYSYSDPTGYYSGIPDASGHSDFAYFGTPAYFDDVTKVGSGSSSYTPTPAEIDLAKRAAAALQSASNGSRDHLTDLDISGAAKEAAGNPVIWSNTGNPIQHLYEVQTGIDAYKNAFKTLASLYKQKGLTPADYVVLNGVSRIITKKYEKDKERVIASGLGSYIKFPF